MSLLLSRNWFVAVWSVCVNAQCRLTHGPLSKRTYQTSEHAAWFTSLDRLWMSPCPPHRTTSLQSPAHRLTLTRYVRLLWISSFRWLTMSSLSLSCSGCIHCYQTSAVKRWSRVVWVNWRWGFWCQFWGAVLPECEMVLFSTEVIDLWEGGQTGLSLQSR